MPAGTGKTHLLATAAAVAAEAGSRSLVLTHTHAGVDAIRRRLRRFGVPAGMVRVDTLASWAFTLSRSYSFIAGVQISKMPDWTQSRDYLDGASRVVRAKAIADMHSTSFDYLFVDEYQDCSIAYHDFVRALAETIPRTIVLGDRLQGIFTFDGPTVHWDHHVLVNFPRHEVPVHPHRWTDHNVDLGAWLLETRALLATGSWFDFAEHDVPGLQFVPEVGAAVLARVSHGFRDFNESVVLLDKWSGDVAGHASRLGGSYTVMEDIGGRFMKEKLEGVPEQGDPGLARWFADFAKSCVIGLSGLDGPVLGKLERRESVAHYKRDGLEEVLVALDTLQVNPTYEQVAVTARIVRDTPGLRLYRWEAWNDTREALLSAVETGESVLDSLARVRDRVRRAGRRSENRVASRTLLVKGLEYDHVVIADLSKMTDPCNLYVAMSRARKTVTVLGPGSRIFLRAGS